MGVITVGSNCGTTITSPRVSIDRGEADYFNLKLISSTMGLVTKKV